jgi:hypothetical protein
MNTKAITELFSIPLIIGIFIMVIEIIANSTDQSYNPD